MYSTAAASAPRRKFRQAVSSEPSKSTERCRISGSSEPVSCHNRSASRESTSATLYQALGIYLPLITTNCAVLGVALLNIQEHYNFLESLVYGFTGGLGFTLAIVLFSSVRQRVEEAECPESFRGFPIALISAGLLALAFMGFSGLRIF